MAAVGFYLLSAIPWGAGYFTLVGPMLLLGMGLGFPVAALPGLAVSAADDKDAGMAGGVVYTQVYLFASLATVFSTLAYLGMGRLELYAAVEDVPLPLMLRMQWDALLAGHMDAPQQAIDAVAPGLTNLTVTVLRDAVTIGFRAVMRLLAAVALLGGMTALALSPDQAVRK